eukprot:CAMPEP_0115560136 /NCGR_PEP_ID=MMETSP0271-20121206/100314_1 /TAXON_ID=71861 /ORGANISM="Scrippsiella trochoidea, Strain CCMP3099" /LENGTH=67 /DNA_ID=CAMNT_0002994205 /DNA_START=77 /DNA_END=278 /DNA_ORIENTATION=+
MIKHTAPTTTATMIQEPWGVLSVTSPGKSNPGKSKAPLPGESFKLDQVSSACCGLNDELLANDAPGK